MADATFHHDYTSKDLVPLLITADAQWEALCKTLSEIQDLTGIPGLHTNINSEDDTPGVLERIQHIYDNQDEPPTTESAWIEVFKSFDEEEVNG